MVRISIVANLFNSNIKGGTATASGDGITKVFTILHGMDSVPTNVTVEDASIDSIGSRVISKDGTNITITYEVAPPMGTDNLVWIWTAIKVVT